MTLQVHACVFIASFMMLFSKTFGSQPRAILGIGAICYDPKKVCETLEPCENGGECSPTDDHEEFKCDCPLGFGGKICEKKLVTLNVEQIGAGRAVLIILSDDGGSWEAYSIKLTNLNNTESKKLRRAVQAGDVTTVELGPLDGSTEYRVQVTPVPMAFDEAGPWTNEITFETYEVLASCSEIKKRYPSSTDGSYVIDPDTGGSLDPFTVLCDMSGHAGVGVTVISHNSENRTLVDGFEEPGSYSRDVTYTGASLAQLGSLTRVSSHCEQFIKYECLRAGIFKNSKSWLVSRDGVRMNYWGGASPNSSNCACGMTRSCKKAHHPCNCDKNDGVWREDSGLLTYKPDLPVSQLRFGDTGVYREDRDERGYHTLGKLKCYGVVEDRQLHTHP